MVPHRDAWRDTVHKAASQFEENRRDSLKNKRQRRKAQAASTTKNPDLTYTARGPACLASASSATNGPPVGVDNNLPDLRSRSQAKQQFLPLSLLKFRSLIFFFSRMKLQTSFAIRIGRKIVSRESHLSSI